MNHYQALGVNQEAEPEVIKAAYKALSNKYHPDKNSSKSAGIKMRAINEAYEILSDSSKRSEYDKELSKGGKESEENFDDDNAESVFNDFDKQTSEDWSFAVEYFPNIDANYKSLSRISLRTANTYRLQLLANKKYKEADLLASSYKDVFLRKTFGSDSRVRFFGEQLLLNKDIDAAQELNRAVCMFQGQADIREIAEKICVKHNSGWYKKMEKEREKEREEEREEERKNQEKNIRFFRVGFMLFAAYIIGVIILTNWSA